MTVLSGGERRRLALAIVVASGANFLVLDEPTNHLDLESREALEAALEAFPGTVLLVSHDRALLDAVAQRTLAIEDRWPPLVRGRLGGAVRRREERREGRRAAGAEGHEEGQGGSSEAGRPDRPPGGEADIAAPGGARSPSSSASWRRTGATPTFCAGIARRATSSKALLARWERAASNPSGV